MLILANTILCAALILLSLNRVCSMTSDTRRSISYANAFMGAGAFAAGIAPFAWGMAVHPAILIMEGGHVAFLLACKRLWMGGTPQAFVAANARR